MHLILKTLRYSASPQFVDILYLWIQSFILVMVFVSGESSRSSQSLHSSREILICDHIRFVTLIKVYDILPTLPFNDWIHWGMGSSEKHGRDTSIHHITYCIYIPGKSGFCFHYYCAVYDEFKQSDTFWLADRIQLFVHNTISLSSLRKLIWRHWTYKMAVRYILSSVWVRSSIFS